MERANFFALLLLFFIFSIQGYSQVSLKGPVYPPPKLSSITSDHLPNEGGIGRAGGIVFTYSDITLANTTNVYWSMITDSIKLSMDGSVYDSSEILVFNPDISDLANGIASWTGSTKIPAEGSDTIPLLSKFTITVVDFNDDPLQLIEGKTMGLPENTGGMVHDTGSTMVFKVKMEMFVSYDSINYIPYLDYYEAAPTPVEAISAFVSCSAGFYWEDDPPVLENNLVLNVDEGDTVTVTNTALKAVDLESAGTDIFFIVDPRKEGLLPANGKLMKSDIEIAPGDTFSMDDIDNEYIAYLHDGSETAKDSISLMLVDGDGKKYMAGEDSIFFLIFTITPLDDSPVVSVNEGLTLDEGGSGALSVQLLLTTDPESNISEIRYTIDPESNSAAPSHGILKLDNVPLVDGNVFTQAEINDGKVVYQHDGSEGDSDGFVFKVEDGTGNIAEDNGADLFFFEIYITPVNDMPVLTKNATIEVNQGSEITITSAYLAASDAESGDADIIFTIDPGHDIQQPNAGAVKLSGTTLSDGQTFTMADINDSKVTYKQDGTSKITDFIPFSVSDRDGGILSDGGFTVFHFNISIRLASGLEDEVEGDERIFTISPNPVSDQIYLIFNAETAGKLKLMLFNNAGEKIWEKVDAAAKDYNIPFSDYPSGLYYLRVELNNEIQTEKVIKK